MDLNSGQLDIKPDLELHRNARENEATGVDKARSTEWNQVAARYLTFSQPQFGAAMPPSGGAGTLQALAEDWKKVVQVVLAATPGHVM